MKLYFLILFLLISNCKKIEFDKGLSPVLTGWEESSEKLHSNYCRDCHTKTHINWSQSIHSKSWSNELFQNGFRSERLDWCVHCHAPLLAQKIEYKNFYNNPDAYFAKNSLLEEGINCAVCHVRNGRIYGAKFAVNSSHWTFADPTMQSSEFCAGCHQFNFPILKNGTLEFSHVPMQNVYNSLKNSGSKKECQDCHWKKHLVNGPSSVLWMEKIFSELEIEKISTEIISVSFSIQKERVHNLPEGDLFRSLVLEVSRSSDFSQIVFSKKFARKYKKGNRSKNQIWNRELEEDSSILPENEFLSFTIDYPHSEKPFARLIYYFHDPDLGGVKEGKGFFHILKTTQ